MTTDAGIRTAIIHQAQYRALRHLVSPEFWVEVEQVIAPGVGTTGPGLDALGVAGDDLDYQDSYRAVEVDDTESAAAEE